MALTAAEELELIRLKEESALHYVMTRAKDPLAFVEQAFPWGEPGELESYEGPDQWQREVLIQIRDGLSPNAALRIAVASGHGVGKSALVAWLILWAMATMPDTKGIVTANTEVQLRSKTWSEVAKWFRLFMGKAKFTLTATALHATDPQHERTWRIDAIAWSEARTEAFAGLHNQGKRVIALFDESSSIPDVIWETTEGALTDARTEIIWAAFGNPTRNTGRLRECFGRFRNRWRTYQVDSRTAKLANKTQIAQWIADYGEDSDFVRVRVRGVFPRAGTMQFISSEAAELAMSSERDVTATVFDPLIMGVDVARFGCFDEETEILTDGGWMRFRQLSGSERVLTLDGDDVKWGPIEAVHRYPFCGMMNLHETVKANFCVTDNHRFLVRSHQKSDLYTLKEYRDLPETYMVRAWGRWAGEPIGSMSFTTAVDLPHGGQRIHRHTFTGEDWAAFLGWFISEGNVYVETRKSPRYRILIAQTPGPKQDKIVALLTRMGIAWRMTPNSRQIEFTSQSVGRHLVAECGVGAANKRVPRYMRDASAAEIEVFLAAFMAGDGTVRTDGHGGCFITSSRLLADDLHEMLAKVGRAGALVAKNMAGSVFAIGNRQVIRSNDTFTVYERTDRGRSAKANPHRDRYFTKSEARRVPYAGDVWCVSTPAKTIYVRRHGKPMWSGNSDQSVIRLRRGRDARTIPPIKLRGVDTMTLAAEVARAYEEHRPDAIFIDEGGVGGGVVDRCRFLRLPVVGVQFGAKADRSVATGEGAVAYSNKRAEMWGTMRDWLEGGMLDADPEMLADLTGVEYGYRMIEGRDAIQLEAKADMKKRGLASPDNGDALALTFAFPVQPSDHTRSIAMTVAGGRKVGQLESDYQVYGDAWNVTGKQGPREPERRHWLPGQIR